MKLAPTITILLLLTISFQPVFSEWAIFAEFEDNECDTPQQVENQLAYHRGYEYGICYGQGQDDEGATSRKLTFSDGEFTLARWTNSECDGDADMEVVDVQEGDCITVEDGVYTELVVFDLDEPINDDYPGAL